jgi:hypothetical protein
MNRTFKVSVSITTHATCLPTGLTAESQQILNELRVPASESRTLPVDGCETMGGEMDGEMDGQMDGQWEGIPEEMNDGETFMHAMRDIIGTRFMSS